MDYFIIINNTPKGPFPPERLQELGLRPDSPVWCQGMADWQPASTVAELAGAIRESENIFRHSEADKIDKPDHYFAVIDGLQQGPYSQTDLQKLGIDRNTPVWKEGMTDWRPAGTIEDLSSIFDATPPPFQADRQDQIYGDYSAENRQKPSYDSMPRRSAWLGWSIAATIINFIFTFTLWFPFIGMILGIIGIVMSSNASGAYIAGNDIQGDSNENTARICTIISLAFASIPIALTITLIIFTGAF